MSHWTERDIKKFVKGVGLAVEQVRNRQPTISTRGLAGSLVKLLLLISGDLFPRSASPAIVGTIGKIAQRIYATMRC